MKTDTDQWDQLLDAARNAHDEDSVNNVLQALEEAIPDEVDVPRLTGQSIITPEFNESHAAQVGAILARNYISSDVDNPLDSDFFDTLFNTVAGHDAAPQLVIEMSKDVATYEGVMLSLAEDAGYDKAAFFLDNFDSYLSEDEMQNPQVNEALNTFFRSYQNATQEYFDFSVLNIPAVIEPYNQFKEVMAQDVKDRISDQVTTAAQRMAFMAGTNLWQFKRDEPEYKALLESSDVDETQFMTEDAYLDMRCLGLADLARDVETKSISMISHVQPNQKREAMMNLSFAMQYCDRECGIDPDVVNKWRDILDENIAKGIASDHEGAPLLSHDN